jgi:L-ribulokinase
MQVAGTSQACALGAAIAAAVLAGIYPDFGAAQAAMASLKPRSYTPEAGNQRVYEEIYTLYLQLHDAFGGVDRCCDLSGVMKRLITLKEEALGAGLAQS